MLGKKAQNLKILKQHNFPVPDFVTVFRDTDLQSLKIPWEVCAVRSCAEAEDGEGKSFAGQFDTFLNVRRADVVNMIEKCFASMYNSNVKEYASANDISATTDNFAVIVQEMVASEVSGVCFTANPQGLLNETVIVAGRGTGDGIVEDKVDTTSYYYNTTDKVYYYEGKEDLISDKAVEELVRLSEEMKPLLGELLDIEYAIAGDKLYILQARNITTIDNQNPLILDNSNIVESYPGLSLPLTASFVNVVYSGIFRSISRRVLKNERELAKYDHVFGNMVGCANGRMYYKISNWYTIIKFLPMNKKIIPIWQDMMGVKIRNYDEEAVKLPRLLRIKTYFNVIWEMLRVQKNMKELNENFTRINEDFYARYHKEITPAELIGLYQELHDTLLTCWDVTLLNDLYAFLFTGLVKKRMGEKSNRVISGISNIESLKPVKEMLRLAYDKRELSEAQYEERFLEYIRLYGDRNLEELKLESKTFRSHPELLEEKIEQYNEDPEKLASMYEQLYKEASEAEKVKGINGYLVRRAEKGIANREISRLNRSRIFGMVRLIFTRMGEVYAEEGLLQEKEDVFWLTVEEAFALAEDKKGMQAIVSKRKREYELYACLPAYQRLIFAEKEFDKKHTSLNAHKIQLSKEALQGTPCSDGIVEGEALVVTDVAKVGNVKDKILVTKMTDPGWVFLLVRAKGVISEKGSLLSHTAIISRELKVPSVVGVEGLMNTVKTGDILRMNGNTGEITIVKR